MQGNVFDSEVYAILIQPVRLILFICNALLYILIHVFMVEEQNQRNSSSIYGQIYDL